MLRTLLTPLVARFDLSPRTPNTPLPQLTQNEDDIAPEDFARDVITELMRNAVEDLKFAEDTKTKQQVLTEIQRIMQQDAHTKDVFRELDGFLTLMSLLSSVQDRQHTVIVEPEEQVLLEVLEIVRLIFMNLAEATHEHLENSEYFRNAVGYESLSNSLRGLVSDSKTVDQTLGLLLSFAIHDFDVSDIFQNLRGTPDEMDVAIAGFEKRLRTIRHPGAILILWEATPRLAAEDAKMRYAVFKLFELLSHVSHRNQAILSSLGLVKSVFSQFYDSRSDSKVPERERYVLQKFLRRMLDMGATTSEARIIFQKALKDDDTLDAEVLDTIRFGIKSRWLEHFSMESPAALSLKEESIRGMPPTGFTFMIWLWISAMTPAPHSLFTVNVGSSVILSLSILPDGKLEFSSSGNGKTATFSNVKLHKLRWTHVTLIYYPARSSNPTVRLFIDGALMETLNWSYPKTESNSQTGAYVIGDASPKAKMSWCIASAYLMASPLDDDIPRFIHHLGPRYTGNFQDPALVKFLTYDASTSLNMFLMTVSSKQTNPSSQSLLKIIREGLRIAEASIHFTLSPHDTRQSGFAVSVLTGSLLRQFTIQGDVFVVKAESLDTALWKIGGAAVVLRLVQAASTQHEVSRALGVLCDGLKNSWQNSEDMERLRGYEILADILRGKGQMINISGFETIFEFLGLNFRSPEQSTIVNTMAYRAIALDLELWAHTRKEIQEVYLEHFTTLLQTSRYKKFNSQQRLGKMGIVRRFLFALQMDWYHQDMIQHVMDALKVAMWSYFSKEETIKPIVSFLAANLHDDFKGGASSPRSLISVSRIDHSDVQTKAAQALELLISTLSIQSYHTKFAGALPLTRICLLLLSDKPTPNIAAHILTLIGISNTFTSSFSRKFELISGWSVLKIVIPPCWDPNVKQAAFDILLGRYSLGQPPSSQPPGTIVCPNIVPTILSALSIGLTSVANNCRETASPDNSSSNYSWAAESDMEGLVEELMDLHASSPTFRQVFQSQQTTQLFVDAYKEFVSETAEVESINEWTRRILDKITHLGLALALDPIISGSQKREILNTLQTAQKVLNPGAEKLGIDPSLLVDARSVRQRIASARFSMHVGERTIIKTITRMSDWRKNIQVSEHKRLRKSFLDLRENRRQISCLNEWTNLLTSERGLWPHQETRIWRLDEIEGPYRIRKKLEPQNARTPSSRVDGNEQNTREVQAPEVDSASVHQIEVPPWAESYEISTTEAEDRQLAEDISDDKHRRVRHELEPGDVIEAVGTVARIAGVDSSPGLLIIGRTHLYMLDGLVEDDDGEVIAAQDAPKRLFFVPGSIVELDGPQRAQRWSHDQISTYSERTCLFRDVALEIYFKDSRSLLMVFLDKKKRSGIDQRLASIVAKRSTDAGGSLTPGILKTPLFNRIDASKVLSGLRPDELAVAQRKWQAREISNFSYICILNQISGRTPSDATQYPVFPWVLKDYTSQTLDLHSPDSYRDLTKPMGALTPARQEAAEARYSNLESVEEKPFHYGTHFSSSMIVCHFLIRMAPFTNMFKTLQGGDWDLPDRLFSDLPRAYESASQDVRGDVRELIPEFFTCPEFLENYANLDFGVQQNTGERIHHVKLPPWAREDPLLFIVMNRRALESDYVSEHLPAWIDLIWGCKQRDPGSLNVFHPLSYEGSIDLDSITDELEREATVGIIHNFGQTPRKLFNSPHPDRFNHGLSHLPLGVLHGIEEDPHLLIQGSRCFRDLGSNTPVRELCLDTIGEKIIPCPDGVLCLPSYPHEQIEWRAGGVDLRVLVDHKVVQVVESALCTCAAFADSNNLVTGSSDFTVRLWKVLRGGSGSGPASPASTRVVLSHIMRIHTDEVVCITASRTWSLIVSGSKDGSAALWDLNRGVYVRSIWHTEPEGGERDEMTAVNLVAINESTGYIATCSRLKLCLHTINARPIATLDLTTTPSYSKLVPTITAIAFHEREYSHLGVLATGGPDGGIVLRTWTADGTPEGERAQWEFVTIKAMKARAVGKGVTRPPSVTSLRFLGESLVHGEETGKSFIWSLPDS